MSGSGARPGDPLLPGPPAPTIGATQVRFLYGFPFALVFLAIATAAAQSAPPAPNAVFLAFTAAGSVAQFFGMALQLAAMRERSFSVATAFVKTEPVTAEVVEMEWRMVSVIEENRLVDAEGGDARQRGEEQGGDAQADGRAGQRHRHHQHGNSHGRL